MTDIKLNQRVLVLFGKPGTVVGFGTEIKMPKGIMMPLILVRLDEGFYSPEKNFYISLVCVSPDNLEAV